MRRSSATATDLHNGRALRRAYQVRGQRQLATRISFMNELSRLCEISGRTREHPSGHRLGHAHRDALPVRGARLRGSCFPKDVKALIQTSKEFGLEARVLMAVEDINHEQRMRFRRKVKKHFGGDVKGKTFAVWGLSFKPQARRYARGAGRSI